MNTIINLIDSLVKKVGIFISHFNHILVLLICIDVIMRYLFNFSKIWIMELELYIYSFIFLLGSAYAFQKEKHVRVDVIYARLSDKKKAIINIMGGILYLLPWSAVLVVVSYQYAFNSFKIGETSAQPGGLPAIYILKFSVCIAFALLFLQGISSILKSVLFLLGRESEYRVNQEIS